jgi:signal transduction histidine kinase
MARVWDSALATPLLSHGGRLWAADHPPRGAGFYFTLPIGIEALE